MFCSSDIGWVLGHSFIIYGPLVAGMRSVIFEGKPVGTPSPDVFWEIVDRLRSKHHPIQYSTYTPHPPPSALYASKIHKESTSVNTISTDSKA